MLNSRETQSITVHEMLPHWVSPAPGQGQGSNHLQETLRAGYGPILQKRRMRLSRRVSLASGHASPRHGTSARGRAWDCRARLQEPHLVGSPRPSPPHPSVCVRVCVCVRETDFSLCSWSTYPWDLVFCFGISLHECFK